MFDFYEFPYERLYGNTVILHFGVPVYNQYSLPYLKAHFGHQLTIVDLSKPLDVSSIDKLTAYSRLYIDGHGAPSCLSISPYYNNIKYEINYLQLANLIEALYAKPRSATPMWRKLTISLILCYSASTDQSIAPVLHEALLQRGVDCEVIGRTKEVVPFLHNKGGKYKVAGSYFKDGVRYQCLGSKRIFVCHTAGIQWSCDAYLYRWKQMVLSILDNCRKITTNESRRKKLSGIYEQTKNEFDFEKIYCLLKASLVLPEFNAWLIKSRSKSLILKCVQRFEATKYLQLSLQQKQMIKSKKVTFSNDTY